MTVVADVGPVPARWTDAELDRMVSVGILPANHNREGIRFTRDQYRSRPAESPTGLD